MIRQIMVIPVILILLRLLTWHYETPQWELEDDAVNRERMREVLEVWTLRHTATKCPSSSPTP